MSISIQKRCICGRSAQFPICDGQHGTLHWQCSPNKTRFHPRVILSTAHYLSLAEALAHQHDLVTQHQHPGVTHCEELIVLHDTDDLSLLLQHVERISHHKRRIISIDGPTPPVLRKHPAQLAFQVQSSPLKQLLDVVDQVLNATESAAQQLPERIFMSHAVSDEARLLPSIERLRHQYDCHPFLCADTIPAGQRWHDEIESALRSSHVVLAFCSEAYNRSTYCAYEIGFAQALEIPVRPILLDGQAPPAFLQHLNAPSIPRIQKNNPWFSDTDSMTAAIFFALQGLGGPNQ